MNRRRFIAGFALLVNIATPQGTPAEATSSGTLDAESVYYERGWKNGHQAGYCEGWDLGERIGYSRAEQEAAPVAVVQGALFDFMGYLTTLPEPITLSHTHPVGELLKHYDTWSEKRGITGEDPADVLGWPGRLIR